VERWKPLSFSLDSSLGRLARWLRLLGHDAAWEVGDDLTGALRRARAEKRTLLTRSHDLERLGLTQPPAGMLCIESTVLDEQLAEVAQAYPIFQKASPFSRCSQCNLATIAISPAAALPRVPPFVARTQEHYRKCPSCGRIFWRATHAAAILRRLRECAERSRQALSHPEESE
jgi:uncharacterized protein with PIN domain